MNKAEFELLKDKIVLAERLVMLYQDEYKLQTGGRFVAPGPRSPKDLLAASKEITLDLWRVTT